jgi:hypothetical protein
MITSRSEPAQQSLLTKLSQYPEALAAWDEHAAAKSALQATQAAKTAALAKVPCELRPCRLNCRAYIDANPLYR